jgi:5'-nucleotidase
MTAPRSKITTAAGALVFTALLLAGCGSSKKADDASASVPAGQATTASAPARPLRILVTNDDGYAAKGIDAVVEALRAQPDTEVTVVAPLANQSGSDGKTTAGPLTVTDVTTASGYPAQAVDGYPADTIVWALDQHGIDFTPDLVVSGINFGQNLGEAITISGTVGAARAAATRGVPALAASQGFPDPVDFPAGVAQVLTWLSGQRAALLSGGDRSPVLLQNLNIPTCTAGSVRGVVDVPISTADPSLLLGTSDCTSTATDPKDDLAGFSEGFATITDLPLQAS